jgi:hypothetical protein
MAENGYIESISMDSPNLDTSSDEYTDEISKIFARIEFLIDVYKVESSKNNDFVEGIFHILSEINITLCNDFNEEIYFSPNDCADTKNLFEKCRSFLRRFKTLAGNNSTIAAIAQDSIHDLEQYLDDRKIIHKINPVRIENNNNNNPQERQPSAFNQFMKAALEQYKNQCTIQGLYYNPKDAHVFCANIARIAARRVQGRAPGPPM